MRIGLMTGGGLLVAEQSLAREFRPSDALGKLPGLARFVEPLAIALTLAQRDVLELIPASTIEPDRVISPATALPLEGRFDPQQSEDRFRPQAILVTRIGANTNAKVHLGLPARSLWGFNLGGEGFSSYPPLRQRPPPARAAPRDLIVT